MIKKNRLWRCNRRPIFGAVGILVVLVESPHLKTHAARAHLSPHRPVIVLKLARFAKMLCQTALLNHRPTIRAAHQRLDQRRRPPIPYGDGRIQDSQLVQFFYHRQMNLAHMDAQHGRGRRDPFADDAPGRKTLAFVINLLRSRRQRLKTEATRA